ncbi:MAG: hypothetical protein WCX22_02960 [Methanoregula sp.]
MNFVTGKIRKIVSTCRQRTVPIGSEAEIRDTVSLAPGTVICCNYRERDSHICKESVHEEVRID